MKEIIIGVVLSVATIAAAVLASVFNSHIAPPAVSTQASASSIETASPVANDNDATGGLSQPEVPPSQAEPDATAEVAVDASAVVFQSHAAYTGQHYPYRWAPPGPKPAPVVGYQWRADTEGSDKQGWWLMPLPKTAYIRQYSSCGPNGCGGRWRFFGGRR